jgi:hypothetical protein
MGNKGKRGIVIGRDTYMGKAKFVPCLWIGRCEGGACKREGSGCMQVRPRDEVIANSAHRGHGTYIKD